MHGTWEATSISFDSTNFLKVNGVTENIVGTLRSLICAYYRFNLTILCANSNRACQVI